MLTQNTFSDILQGQVHKQNYLSFPDCQHLWERFEKSQEVGHFPASNVIFFAKAAGFGGLGEEQLIGLQGLLHSPRARREQ